MDSHMRAARIFSHLLDKRFKLFGVRFGLDPIIGMVPWLGDLISFLLSLYIIWIAVRTKLPAGKIFQMIFITIIDLLVGLVPVLGDVGDFFYRANAKNYEILERYKKTGSKVIEGEVVS